MKRINLIIAWMVISVGLVSCGSGSSEKEEVVHKSGTSELMADYAHDAIQISELDSKYSVKAYRIVYETKDKSGNYINVSGLLSIPQKSTQAKSQCYYIITVRSMKIVKHLV